MRVYIPKNKALTFSNGRWYGGEPMEQTDATTELKQRQRIRTPSPPRGSVQPRRPPS
jgi:hypothetical protein